MQCLPDSLAMRYYFILPKTYWSLYYVVTTTFYCNILILKYFIQHENEELRQAVEGLAQSVQILQEENILNEAQRERDYNNREHEEHFTTAPNTPSVADPLSDERKSRELDEQMVALEFDGACRDAAPITPIALLNCLNDANIEGNMIILLHM